MFCCVRGYGGRRAWRIMVSPTGRTPFPFRPMHARPVWCWPACVWSVYGHIVFAAVVFLVCGRVSRLMVGLFGVGSLALQRALAQSDRVRVGALLVPVLAGASCVGPARYVLTVRRPPVGEKSNDRWFDRCKVCKFGATFPVPPWQRHMHNSSSGIPHCPLAVLAASPVPFICTPPSVARPRRSCLVLLRAPHGSPRVLFRLGGAVLVLVSACLPCAVSCRVSQVMWLACLCRSAEFGG